LSRRPDLDRLLRGNAPGFGTGARLRSALVVAQVALSLTLLLGAGLLLRSLGRLLATPPGFETTQVWSFGIGVPEARYDAERKLIVFHERLRQRLLEIPGVDAVGVSFRLPAARRLGDVVLGTAFWPEGTTVPRERLPRALVNVVSPGYLSALRIPLLRGRDLEPGDGVDAPRVLVVNEAMAMAYWPDQDVVGRRLEIGWRSDLNPAGTPWRIVGVVGDTRSERLDQAPRPEILLPSTQVGLDGGVYALRASRADEGLGAAVGAAVESVDPDLERVRLRHFAEAVSDTLADRRLSALLLAAFAGVAVLLTAMGLYALVAWSVSVRSREIAVRLALGAPPGRMAGLALGQTLRFAGLGTVLGLLGAQGLGRVLESHLFGVTAGDIPTRLGAASLLMGVALLAAFGPARRAARVDPAVVLRES
jgi:putative ABC transport system permease protein